MPVSNCKMSELTLRVFNDYKMTLQKEKSRSEYYYVINSFCQFCGKDYLIAGADDFKNYFESLDTAAALGNLSYKTICMRHAVMINFGSYISSHAKTYEIKGFVNYMVKIPKPGVSINITSRNIPTLEQLDKIYEAAQEDMLMYCVIALVNKCALTVKQICDLKITNFIYDSERNCGMIFPYQYSADRYIKLPDDVRDILNNYVSIRNTGSEYLFCNQKNGKMTQRVLQNRMKNIITIAAGEEGWSYTLQDIRNMATVLMIKGGAEKEDVAAYIGIEAKWMQRYDRAVEEFVLAPCDYINIDIRNFKSTRM